MSEITISTGHPDAGRIYAEALHRVTAERDALQVLLTAADERADVLGGQLAESERKRLEFVDAVKVETDLIEASHSSCVMVPEGYAVVPIKPTKAMREACQIAGKLPVWDAMMAAALKPAEVPYVHSGEDDFGHREREP
ncbi:hypothetical protein [Pseudomonas sivasensis]|uniref:Uncharacterized protein n=1 Tax=Pseudomonas sivasensis TaxID=1880678 RepID=A0ABW8E510_9PSED